MDNMWSILNNGLLNASGTRLERTGAAACGQAQRAARPYQGPCQALGAPARPRAVAELPWDLLDTLGRT